VWHIGVGKGAARHRGAIHERTVLAVRIFDQPGAEHSHEPRVHGRHPAVGHTDREATRTFVGRARHRPLVGATDDDLVDRAQGVACRTREWSLAFEPEIQKLAEVGGPGRIVVAHVRESRREFVASHLSSPLGIAHYRKAPSQRNSMTSLPEWIDPMAATLAYERFGGPEWIFERKIDGIRLLAFKDGQDVELFSRNRLPQTIPAVADAIARLPVSQVVLDGELTWERGAYHVRTRTGFGRKSSRRSLSSSGRSTASFAILGSSVSATTRRRVRW
jgi:hypothetical protein